MKNKIIRKGTRVRFSTPFSEVGNFSSKEINGLHGKVKNVYRTPDKEHDSESLPMFRVRLDDGREIEAFPEELSRKLSRKLSRNK